MEKWEKDIEDKIRQKAEQMEIPSSLQPEQIEKLLDDGVEKKQSGRRVFVYRAAALAACLVLAVSAGVLYKGGAGRESLSSSAQEEENEVSQEREIASAETYGEVYEYIKEYEKDLDRGSWFGAGGFAKSDGAMEDSVASSAADTGASKIAASSASGYSETNVRQTGVDEGDIVKTDGRYLYIVKENSEEVSIVDTSRDNMKEVSSIQADEDMQIQELYLQTEEKNMVLICTSGEKTEAVTYRVEDPAHPVEAGRVAQSGWCHSTRMAEGILYLFSSYSVLGNPIDKDSPETFVPLVNEKVIRETDICLPQESRGCMYLIVTSVDMKQPDQAADSKAMLTEGGELYVSNDNIYYYETVYENSFFDQNRTETTIRRMAYNKGKLMPEAQGSIGGYINDSFSIDEYEGYLRIVTTEEESNSVYILDMKLEETGAIRGLAKDERVYSARFMGDTGYFVTFRETDPLFSVDLSDPEKPEIIGSLKIPGFSDYLHPYGDGKLLGIGMNVDEKTQVTDGVKLTMFDISDPRNVKEENTFILEHVYSTDVSYDYKAALAEPEQNLIGFAGNTEAEDRYYIFSYDSEKGFQLKMEEEINGENMWGSRGVRIGQKLYVVSGNIIEVYSLRDYNKVGDIIL